MTFDAKSIAFAIGDIRLLVLQFLGYLSSIGVICLLFAAFNKKWDITAEMQSYRRIVISEYAASVIMGTAFWYALASHPALYWIPISLFLLITL